MTGKWLMSGLGTCTKTDKIKIYLEIPIKEIEKI